MASEVAGIPLTEFEDPVSAALVVYSERTGGKVRFQFHEAAKLQLTPEKPNSARSETFVYILGEAAAKLFVIAFAPGDGTGDEKSGYKLAHVHTGNYPNAPKVVPRKKGAHSEFHLATVSRRIDQPNSDTLMFANNLDLLSVNARRQLIKTGQLGQPFEEFNHIVNGQGIAKPTTSLTVGYQGALRGLEGGERFRDPHAVYNNSPVVQIAAFFAVEHATAHQYLPMLRELRATEPPPLAA